MSTRNQNQSNYFDVYQRIDKAVTKSKLEPNLCSDQEEKNVRNTTELSRHKLLSTLQRKRSDTTLFVTTSRLGVFIIVTTFFMEIEQYYRYLILIFIK